MTVATTIVNSPTQSPVKGSSIQPVTYSAAVTAECNYVRAVTLTEIGQPMVLCMHAPLGSCHLIIKVRASVFPGNLCTVLCRRHEQQQFETVHAANPLFCLHPVRQSTALSERPVCCCLRLFRKQTNNNWMRWTPCVLTGSQREWVPDCCQHYRY